MRATTNNRVFEDRGGIDIEDFLTRLDKVQKRGKKYLARCPAHEDGRPSLIVSQGDKGIMVSCFAGCTFHEIVQAVDLSPRDMFTDALTPERQTEYKLRGIDAEIRRNAIKIHLGQNLLESGKITDDQRKELAEAIQIKGELYDARNALLKRI